MADSSRVIKELKACAKDAELSGCSCEKVGGDLKHLKGTIKGPDG